jgi:hypothetical protein
MLAMASKQSLPITVEIVSRIIVVRGRRVLLDSELAALYGVTTKRLNEQARRNVTRFPDDFAFQLSDDESSALRSQFATLDRGRGKHRKYRPWAFAEHGALMATNTGCRYSAAVRPGIRSDPGFDGAFCSATVSELDAIVLSAPRRRARPARRRPLSARRQGRLLAGRATHGTFKLSVPMTKASCY